MALSAAEEAQTRELLAQQAAILSLADSEAEIISNLGATDVSLSDLTAASSVSGADLLLIRQGVTDKSITPDVLGISSFATKPGLQQATYIYSVAGGTSTAITATYTPTISALTNGMTLYVRAAAANSTTAPTFTPNGGTIAAKTIVKGNGIALVAGDIAGAGHWIGLQYDLTLDKWVLCNPATAINALGYGQTAQDVLASRALGTTYTNTSGRPIFATVAASISSTSSSTLVATVGGTDFWGTTASGVILNSSSVSFIVPNLATYSLSMRGAAATLFHWAELR